MDDKVMNNANLEKEDEEAVSIDTNTRVHPGEKGFSIFLFLFGAFFVYQSLLLYKKDPGLSSCSAVPFAVSSLIVIFSILIFFEDFRKVSINKGVSVSKKIINTLQFMFTRDVVVLIILIFLYSVGLFLGLGFYPVTAVFLWMGISYLMKKGYVKNIIVTAGILVFIYLVFSYVFQVVMP